MNYKLILKVSGSFVIIVAAILIFSFFQQGTTIESGMKIQVGYLPVAANLPLFVALEEGYFKKYNLTVEAIEFESPNLIVSGIASGDLDGAGVLAYPILFAAEEKSPGLLKIFHSGDETETEFVASILVKKNSNLTKVEDLKNKKIGVYTGLVQVVFLKGIIIGMGLNPEKDIQIVQIEPRLQLQGLETGQYDALSTVEPFPTIAVDKRIGKILVSNPRVKYIQNPFPSVATPLSSAFIEKNPIAAKAYVLAIGEAIEFIRRDPEKAKTALQKYASTEVTPGKIGIMHYNLFGEENRTSIQKLADWMFENGLQKNEIDVNSIFGSSNLLR